MQTLESRTDCDAILQRISALTPIDNHLWGKMTVNQMICHLRDAYLSGLGEKAVSPATGFLQQSVIKWIALRSPIQWPKGSKTRPEVEQGVGGTPPVEFESDRAALVEVARRFSTSTRYAETHPFFGPMTREEWRRWGYLHADHHLRQFGR